MTDLGASGHVSSAAGVNDSGVAAGYQNTGGGAAGDRATTWSPGSNALSSTQSRAEAINDSGQVAGTQYYSSTYRAAVWDGSTMTDLGSLATSGSMRSYGWAINDNGDVAGSSDNNGTVTGAVWQSGTSGYTGYALDPVNSPNSGSVSEAFGINDNGLAVGESTVSGSTGRHATVWQPDTLNGGYMIGQDLGLLAGANASSSTSFAYDINNANQVVGYSGYMNTGGAVHAAFWDGLSATPIDLGSLGGDSYAYAINEAGTMIVGYSGGGIATLWKLNGTSWDIYDLNDLLDTASIGWTLFRALGINANGQIVGFGTNGDFNHAVLLTPATASAVPLPPAAALFGSGLGLLGVLGWRRRRRHACSAA